MASWLVLIVLLVVPGGCRDDSPGRNRATTLEAGERARTQQIKSQFSPWDGSHKSLTKIIKKSLDDPGSYEHVRTRYDDRVVNLVVSTTYRSKGAAGDTVTSTMTAKFDLNGKLLEIVSKH